MKAIVNKDGCISCGVCVNTCPDVFRMDDQDLAEAYGKVTDENVDMVKEAAEDCPVSVITVEE